MRANMAVLGDKASVLGFRAVGLEAVPVETTDEAERALRRLIRGQYAVIFVVEETANLIADTMREASRAPWPILLPIPGTRGSDGSGLRRIEEYVEKAVGANIFSDQD